MDNSSLDTEQKILAAAKTVFSRKGLQGTRMQEIADEAGINRALLNYYFRTKAKLYNKVLMDTLKEITPSLNHQLLETLTLREFVEVMVNFIIDMNLKNPSLILFYVIALNETPEPVLKYISKNEAGRNPIDILVDKIEAAVQLEKVRPLNAEKLLVNITSLCCYPFLTYPLIKSYQDKSEIEMTAFYVQQKKEIVELVWNGIKK